MGASANLAVVTASGRRLGAASGPLDLWRALREFRSLPVSETAPGAVRVGERRPADSLRAPPSPSPGGLILKLYYRALAREAGTELRRAEKKDFFHSYSMAKNPRNPSEIGSIDSVISNKAFYEAQPDFMWLTEAEWKSLLPASPIPGAATEVPAAITERLFRFHLVPIMAYAESIGWAKKDIRGGKMTLIVEEVSKDKVRLRLEGVALLGATFESASKHVWGYEPHLLGYLEYHPAEQKITRFDIVALGDAYGKLREIFCRPGRQPLGVAFGLVHADVPANRVFPRGAPGGNGYREYFATGK
jgi:hypothetical protein